ncbi:hypothetical protein DFH29DRAFT_539643 [Suillus ampliporus]|nr:hypothetical protein DFH29DRAFT_539643 [Suillus ampliporus]
MIRDHEEAQRQQLLTFSDTQPRSDNTNNELSGNNTRASNHLPGIHQASGGDRNHSLFDILAVNTTVRNACITGDLHTAEDLLTQELDADDNNHDSYAIRSVVRARNSQQYLALQDSVMSIVIQPSLFGYISMGIALCGNEKFLDAMEAFDLACVFSDRHPTTVELLLLIKVLSPLQSGHTKTPISFYPGCCTLQCQSSRRGNAASPRPQHGLSTLRYTFVQSCQLVSTCTACNDSLSRTGGTAKPPINSTNVFPV